MLLAAGTHTVDANQYPLGVVLFNAGGGATTLALTAITGEGSATATASHAGRIYLQPGTTFTAASTFSMADVRYS